MRDELVCRLSKENKGKYNFTIQKKEKRKRKGEPITPLLSSPLLLGIQKKHPPLQPLHNPLPLGPPIPLKLHQQFLIHLSQLRTTLQLPHQSLDLARQRRNPTRQRRD